MMSPWLSALRAGAAALELTLTAEQEDQFARFLALLQAYNQQVNLTAITEPTEIAEKHFVDSLTVERVWHPHPGDRVMDIGTGAGFPGIPLAIRHPEISMVLNDSVRKKTDFLAQAIATLHLVQVHSVWARAEVLGRDPAYRQQFNAVFVRAVAHLAVLSEYALPLLKPGNVLICMKGPAGPREVEESRHALEVIGGSVAAVHKFTVHGAGERSLIVLRKVRSTPEEFPRQAGAMKKHPLYLDSKKPSTLE